MPDPLDNPTWTALLTEHAHLAIRNGRAARYPADVSPLAGVSELTSEALTELHDLLAPGESAWIPAEIPPQYPNLEVVEGLPCLQMLYAGPPISPDRVTTRIEKLSADDGPAMVELTQVAFPGLFRPRTYLMGDYFGLYEDEVSGSAVRGSKLIAMSGNRLALPGQSELSAVATRPGHTGQGHAARLIHRVIAEHAAAGRTTFLHVVETNRRAIALYERLGFVTRRVLTLQQLRRSQP